MLHWIDSTSHELVDNTLIDQRPRHVEFSEDGSQLWASSEIGGTVTVIDVGKRTVQHVYRFSIPGIHRDRVQPVGIQLTRDGRYAFVALGPANHIAVIDIAKKKVVKYLLVGHRVWHLALNNNEQLLLSTNGVSGDVSVINVPELKVIKSIKVGRYPWGVAIKP